MRLVATVLDETLIRGTPVDTGRARSNWIVTKGSPFGSGPDKGGIFPYAPGMKLGITETANAAAAIAQGRKVIQSFNAAIDKAIYITNNVIYIGVLDTGHSRQAPTGFTKIAIGRTDLAMRQTIRKLAKDIKRRLKL